MQVKSQIVLSVVTTAFAEIICCFLLELSYISSSCALIVWPLQIISHSSSFSVFNIERTYLEELECLPFWKKRTRNALLSIQHLLLFNTRLNYILWLCSISTPSLSGVLKGSCLTRARWLKPLPTQTGAVASGGGRLSGSKASPERTL